MPDWIHAYATVFWWLGALSIVTFIGTLIVIPLLVACIPADYFSPHQHHSKPGHDRRPVLRFLGHILKNFFGIIFILAGLAMLVLPGQGIITILIGVMLTDFPGKRRLEWRMVQQPAVLNTINWLRARAQQPALDLPDPVAKTPEPDPKT